MNLRAILLAAVLSAATGAALAQTPPEVTVARPITKEIVEDDEFVGRFETVASVEVRARVSGYLEEVAFTDGQMVMAGDLLYRIDKRLFEASYRQAEAEVAIAEASLQFASEQMTRAEGLIANGRIPQSQYDERREAYLAAQGRLETAKEELESSRISLDYSEVRAPISGRIDRTRVTPGNLVRADDTVLTTIVETDQMYFYFDIDERYFLAYSKDARTRGSTLQEGAGGLTVTVRLSDERIPPFSGKLDFSENRIDAATGSMRVRAIVPNPEGILTPGLFGRVNVPGSLPYQGVLIPDQAIVADQNRKLVMTVGPEGQVIPKEVRPGPKIDGYRVIREGLDGSEMIVIEGLMRARPGATVTPVAVELPAVAGN